MMLADALAASSCPNLSPQPGIEYPFILGLAVASAVPIGSLSSPVGSEGALAATQWPSTSVGGSIGFIVPGLGWSGYLDALT